MKRTLSLIALIPLLLLGACKTPLGGIDVVAGERAGEMSYQTFDIRLSDDMPGFLTNLMLSNCSTAFSQLGLHHTADNPDLVVTLDYDQRDIGVSATTDPFSGKIVPGGHVEFIATVLIEIREAGSDDVIYNGSLQRLHVVDPGDYMHVGRASEAVYLAFREALSGFVQ